MQGAKVWEADYFAFGKQYGENKINPGFEEDDLGFTGKGFDGDTGLYYFNARWYDADTGRFISEDPMMDPNNPNLYSYGRNNPINVTDPTGNFSLSDVGITSITGGSGYNPNLEITSPDLGGGSGDGGNNNNSNNNNGSSGNEKKSFWDNVRKWWNDGQEKAKERRETYKQIAEALAKRELARRGIKESDSDYEFQLMLCSINIYGELSGLYDEDIAMGLTGGVAAKGVKVGAGLLSKVLKKLEEKNIPNPFGKKGGILHQGTIKEIVEKLRAVGFKVDTEARIKIPEGGIKPYRFGDILAINPDTGERLIIQVGKITQSGTPVSREVKAIRDLISAGYKVEFVGYNMVK